MAIYLEPNGYRKFTKRIVKYCINDNDVDAWEKLILEIDYDLLIVWLRDFYNEKENALTKDFDAVDLLSAIDTAKSELQTAINIRTQLLARTINKTLIALQGGTISPPKNVYTSPQPGTVGNAASRIFYDVRGDLVGFLGDSLGNVVNGGFNPSQRR